jgi:nicotinate-nucleotide adenylyltransferase
MTVRSGPVGILGGTFDPVHVGHLETALAAQRALDLERVVLMPARLPPHRQQPCASPFHRFAMAALAVADFERLATSDEELRADGPSYTAATLERMHAQGWTPKQIYFITGADAFAEIGTWYRYPAVLDLAHFVVISRPGAPATSLGDRLPALRERMQSAGGSGDAQGTAIFLVDAETPDVSSTQVRRRLAAGEPVTGMIPAAVEAHIARHGLYAHKMAELHGEDR